jgi:prophage tail gpP-like protein
MASSELVTVSVGGSTYQGWEAVAIRASVKAAARSFELKVAAAAGAAATAAIFAPFTPLQAFATGQLIFTGYVDRYRPKLSKSESRIVVSGRAKGQDAVDNAVEHRKPDYVNQTLLQIAQDQDAFGIGFKVDPSVQLTPIDRWRPNPGQYLFDELDQLAHDEECTMAGQADGSILFTRAGVNPKRQAGLTEGSSSVLEWEGDLSVAGLHSQIIVHGQAAYGNGAQNTQISVQANNAKVPRRRPLHIHHHRHTDQGRLLAKATHHRDHEAGNGIRATIVSQGWRDDAGALWTPGNKTFLDSPFLNIVQDMLIESVDYEQDDKEGSRATLHLVDPRAHGGSGGGVNQSGSMWGMGSSPAAAAPPLSSAQ